METNYEQKYNEALERARKLYNSYNRLVLSTNEIEEIFPELAESEDERIRKEIKDIVLSYRRNCVYEGTHHFDECLAWLERQKDNPKNADSISADCISPAKCEDRNSKYGVFPEDVIVVARACEKLEAHGYPELAHALKNVNLYTKEQKPAEWSEEQMKDELEKEWKSGYNYAKEEIPKWRKMPPGYEIRPANVCSIAVDLLDVNGRCCGQMGRTVLQNGNEYLFLDDLEKLPKEE